MKVLKNIQCKVSVRMQEWSSRLMMTHWSFAVTASGDPWDPPLLCSTGTSNKSTPNLLDLSALVGAALDEVCTFKTGPLVRNPLNDGSAILQNLSALDEEHTQLFGSLLSDGHNTWWSVLVLKILVSHSRMWLRFADECISLRNLGGRDWESLGVVGCFHFFWSSQHSCQALSSELWIL